MDDVNQRLDRLERENAQLRRDMVEGSTLSRRPDPDAPGEMRSTFAIGTDSNFSYQMLDPTQAGKSKPLLLMDAARSGSLRNGTIVGGAVTAITDYQTTNMEGKVSYLMRQPENQKGKTASEAALHSAQIGIGTNYAPWLSSYVELLYEPEQSFAAGTITALARNQVQVRRGYFVIGDLRASPFYAMIGKIDSPFGYGATVSPFTLSTTWHTFAGLSYGALVGYSRDGLNVRVEAAQGGAEFRGLNTPVSNTNIPSELNNYVVDANYRIPLGSPGRSFMLGGSYEYGSSYCQSFPIKHFGACSTHNPAWAAYAEVMWDAIKIKGEFNQTVKEWPGTFNPNPPFNIFPASKVTSFDVGAVYTTPAIAWGKPLYLSAEYSKFIAGPSGSQWEFQDQFVTGIAFKPKENIKLFIENIAMRGYAPLQFLTGGGNPADPLDLDANRSALSNVVIAGITAAF